MRKLLIFALLVSSCFAADTFTLYAVDGSSQSLRPVTIGRVFVQGEVAQCPGISPFTVQADVKNRWTDGSVKFAILTFYPTTIATSGTTFTISPVSYSSGTSCNNETFLDKAGIVTAIGSHDPKFVTVANSTTVTTALNTMLADSSITFSYCKMEYFLQGANVTGVKVQDCTATSLYDFGWTWNGTTMSTPKNPGNGGQADKTASNHMAFYVWAYSDGSLRVDWIHENMWSGRFQDQQYTETLKDGSTSLWDTSSAVGNSAGLWTHIGGTRYRKTFWLGTAPGHIRPNHNFAYLVSTKMFPYYDQAFTIDPTVTDPCFSGDPCPTYPSYAATDFGEVGGFATLNKGLDDNTEGAPLQREPLSFYYTQGTGATGNGNAAKTYQMITGRTADGDTTTSASIDGSISGIDVVGGAGLWNNTGNIPYHMRQSAPNTAPALNAFYCAAMADKDATLASGSPTTCSSGGSGTAIGRPLSRHAYISNRFQDTARPDTSVGAVTLNGWSGLGSPHWQDYSYDAYLVTGDPYYLEEEQFAASEVAGAMSADNGGGGSDYFFSLILPIGAGTRSIGWGMQTLGKAAVISPDGTIEKTYYTSIFDSNLEFEEGMLNVTGTSLTPSSTNPNCNTYDNAGAQNRWNFGRCTLFSNCYNSSSDTSQDCRAATNHAIVQNLHSLSPGECSGVLGVEPILDPTQNTDFVQDWMAWGMLTAYGHMKEIEVSTNFSPVYDGTRKRLLEELRDPGSNPYTTGMYVSPYKNGAIATCNFLSTTNNPVYTSWANEQLGFAAAYAAAPNFLTTSGVQASACTSHAYSLQARSASSYLTDLTESCPTSGTCSGLAAWNFMGINGYVTTGGAVPYNGNAAAVADTTGCSSSLTAAGAQVRFALLARASVASCDSLSPSSATIAVLGTQNYTASCTFSDSSTGDCTSVLSLVSGTPSVATVSNQTATGVTGGSSTISGTASGFACGNTSALTVTATTSTTGMLGSSILGGSLH